MKRRNCVAALLVAGLLLLSTGGEAFPPDPPEGRENAQSAMAQPGQAGKPNVRGSTRTRGLCA